MATETRATGTESSLPLHRVTVPRFEKMIDAGAFPDGVRVELIAGVLVEKMTKNDPHDFAVDQLGDILRRLVPAGWFVREEKSTVLGRWDRLEPDIMVVRGRRRDFAKAPRPDDLGLVIEVADSSYAKDRGLKLRRYAVARIAVYGIVNLPKKQVEVFGDPTGRGKAAAYRACQVSGEDAEVPIVLDGRAVGRVVVRDLLS